MSTDYRFMFENGKKYHCPNCNKKRFVRYIDTLNKEQLPEQYGRCDRESRCGYNLNPYLDGYIKELLRKERENDNAGTIKTTSYKRTPPQLPETVFFDFKTFRETLQPERYQNNVFVQNLMSRVKFPFSADEVTKVIQLYRLGTISNGYRKGANTFPFIDLKGNVRAVQVKQFDEENHTTGTDFLHSILVKYYNRNNKPLPGWLSRYNEQDKKVSCLFGEHLLSKFPHNPIALVEAPKTAVYGTLYFGLPNTPDQLLWLAVYNKSSLNFSKLKVLQGRTVFVFPDLSENGNTFKEWKTKAIEIQSRLPGTEFIFSNLLEQLAPEQDRQNGNDLADFLIQQNWGLFRKRKQYHEYTKEERLKAGLRMFSLTDLINLGKEIFKDKKQLHYKEVVKHLEGLGLQGNDIEDLFDVLVIRKVVKAIGYPNYILTVENLEQ